MKLRTNKIIKNNCKLNLVTKKDDNENKKFIVNFISTIFK